MRTILFIATFIFIYTSSVTGQVFGELGQNRVGTTSFQFLKLGVGAREIAMAETGISISNDANALFWNPSHISYLPDFAASFNYNLWYADISQTTFAGSFRWFDDYTFGVSLNYLTTEPMERRTTFQPKGTGEKFNVYNLMAGITVARQMTTQFTFGITGKYVKEQIAEVGITGYLLDIGMTYLMSDENTRLSIALVNFGGKHTPEGTVNVSDIGTLNTFQEVNTPNNFRMGLSRNYQFSDSHALIGTIQLNHPNDGTENYAIGMEYGFSKTFFLRTGLKLNVEGQEFPSFGLGIKKELIGYDFQLDYALAHIEYLGYSHRFTLSLQLFSGDIR